MCDEYYDPDVWESFQEMNRDYDADMKEEAKQNADAIEQTKSI